MDRWTLVKDILLTLTGVLLIVSQVRSKTPDTAMLVTGLALTIPSIADHAKSILGGPAGSRSATGPPSLPSSQERGGRPSEHSSETSGGEDPAPPA